MNVPEDIPVRHVRSILKDLWDAASRKPTPFPVEGGSFQEKPIVYAQLSCPKAKRGSARRTSLH